MHLLISIVLTKGSMLFLTFLPFNLYLSGSLVFVGSPPTVSQSAVASLVLSIFRDTIFNFIHKT